MTFYRREPFSIEAHYSDVSVFPKGTNSWIGSYKIDNVTPDSKGDVKTIKIKARLNVHGILDVSSAQAIEEVLVEDTTPVSPQATTDDAAAKPSATAKPSGTDSAETDAVDTSKEDLKEKEPKIIESKDGKRMKKVTKKSDLPIEGVSASLAKQIVTQFTELENEFRANDKLVIDTEEKRNSLEEYVYDMRGKIESECSDFIVADVFFFL